MRVYPASLVRTNGTRRSFRCLLFANLQYCTTWLKNRRWLQKPQLVKLWSIFISCCVIQWNNPVFDVLLSKRHGPIQEVISPKLDQNIPNQKHPGLEWGPWCRMHSICTAPPSERLLVPAWTLNDELISTSITGQGHVPNPRAQKPVSLCATHMHCLFWVGHLATSYSIGSHYLRPALSYRNCFKV